MFQGTSKIKVIYSILVFAVFISLLVRIHWLANLQMVKFHISIVAAHFGVDTGPMYLAEYFRNDEMSNDRYKKSGNFGLSWKNKTKASCKSFKRRSKPNQHDAVSDNKFFGSKIRTFDHKKLKFRGLLVKESLYRDMGDKSSQPERVFSCKKWAVVTTIFEPPSEAVRRFLYKTDWCVIVVGDKEMPTEVNCFNSALKVIVITRNY